MKLRRKSLPVPMVSLTWVGISKNHQRLKETAMSCSVADNIWYPLSGIVFFLILLRCGWLCKESGCTSRASSSAETSELSFQRRPRNSMTSIRHSRRFVACYASVLHVKVWAKELVIGGRGGGGWQRARVLVQTFGYISFINNQSSI